MEMLPATTATPPMVAVPAAVWPPGPPPEPSPLGAGPRSFPVDEQKPARRVELRFPWPRRDLQLELVDRVAGAVPALQRVAAGGTGVREQHDVHVCAVRHARPVPVEVRDGPERYGAIDGRHQRRV